jgi:hypothetical protein
MKPLAAMCITVMTLCVPVGAQPAPNTLTPAETAAGWSLLFDGTTTHGWRGHKAGEGSAPGWTVADGCLTSVAGEPDGGAGRPGLAKRTAPAAR